ncbi:MAG TPA: LacI family DNA-binding transcriptional regulator [Tepidisphaeraceae bacterium]|nr:LacI family DNA-binding transcriptional regulator [Tepidisphaeraceae bacterium]
MQHVAQLAGVSTSTVSRVFHDDPCVAADTAAVVRQIVRQLGFTPAMRRRRNGTNGKQHRSSNAIAFLVLGTSGCNTTPAFEKLLRGVSDAANANDLSLILSFVSDPSQIPARLLDRQLAGVLCHGDQPGAGGLARLRSLPSVWLMANRHRPRWGDQVMPNNAVIGDLAGRYLVRRGHRRLAYVGVGHDAWSMRLRSFAFVKAAEDAGAVATVFQAKEGQAGDYWSADGLGAAAERLAEQVAGMSPVPTGLFIAEDRLLPVLDRALRSRGLRPGGGSGDADVEIVSCNNEQPHYAGLATQPARIDIRPEAIGHRGVEQLVWRMRNTDLPERVRVMVDPVLIEPESTPRHEMIEAGQRSVELSTGQRSVELSVTAN